METKRSRRVYVYWAIALTLLVTVGLVCWLVVVPIWRVRRAIIGLSTAIRGRAVYTNLRVDIRDNVQRIGGPQTTIRGVTYYLCLPKRSGVEHYAAAWLLGGCGKDAVPLLVRLGRDGDRVGDAAGEALVDIGAPSVPALAEALTDQRSEVREWSAFWLGRMDGRSAAAVPALTRALSDQVPGVRYHAAGALGQIGLGASRAVPALERVLKDEEEVVRQAAAEALKKIKAAEQKDK